MQAGQIALLNRNFQGRRAVLQRKLLRVDDAVAAHGQQAGGGREGGLHQDVGRLAGLITLFVGDQHDALLLHRAPRHGLAAADPARKLAAVEPLLVVAHFGADAIFPTARRRAEGALDRLRRRSHIAQLLVSLDLLPLSIRELPVHAHGTHTDRALGDGGPVHVGHDQIHVDHVALLHKGDIRAQPHVQLGGMHDQRRRGGPGLVIEVHHAALGHHTVGARLRSLDKGHLEVVAAAGVGASGEGQRRRTHAHLAGEVEAIRGVIQPAREPPGRPCAKGEVGPVGWRIAGPGGVNRPVGGGVGQRAAGVVLRRDAHHGFIAQIIGAGRLVGRCHLELWAAELLHLEGVRVEWAVGACFGHCNELQRSVTQVAVDRQRKGQAKAAHVAQGHCAVGQWVAQRVHYIIRNGRAGHPIQTDVPFWAVAHLAHKALDMHFLARAIDAAVVIHHPAPFIIEGGGDPTRSVPGIGRARQYGHIFAQAANEHIGGDQRQCNARQAGCIGRRLAAAGQQLQLNPLHGRAVAQARGPGHHLLIVGNGVEADARHLHPALHHVIILRCEKREQRGGLVHQDDQMARLAAQRRAEIDGRLGQHIRLRLHRDHGFQYARARRLGPAVAPEVIYKLQIERPLLRRHRIGAHAQAIIVHRVDSKDRRRRRGVKRRQRAAWAGQIAVGAARRKGQRRILAQRLAEDILHGGADRHRVLRAARRCAVNRKAAVGGRHRHAGQGRIDGDQAVVDQRGIKRVVELDRKRLTGRAIAATPAAVGGGDAQVAIGLEAE